MKIEMEYVDSLPLRRLEKGDKVVISVFNPLPTDTQKTHVFLEKFKNIKNGYYEGYVKEVTKGGWRIECPTAPELNGTYTYHYGEKYHCYGIHAKEKKEE